MIHEAGRMAMDAFRQALSLVSTSAGVDGGCPTLAVCPTGLAALLGGAAIHRGALIDAEQEIGAVWLRVAQCRAFCQRLVGVVIIMILDVAVVLTVSILVHACAYAYWCWCWC